MRIGSFFLLLLAALVALGYLLSDSLHLRENMNTQQKEIERLTQAAQQVEQDKQNALAALQSTGQELQSCQQSVALSNQINAQVTNENTYLKEQNRLLATSVQASNSTNPSTQPQTQMVQSNAFGVIIFVAVGFGSAVIIGIKSIQKHPTHNGNNTLAGNYVYLTDAEIKELVQRRRTNAKSNMQNSN